MKQSVLSQKAYDFALRSVKLSRFLCDERKEFVLSKQVLRSATSIGANNIEESVHAQSKSDFIHKLSVAQKEASETNYWIRILRDSGYLSTNLANSLLRDCVE